MSEREISTMDRISILPDEVLCHILSFLTTKRTVATSLLSRRWRYVWRHVPVLEFSDTRVETPETFSRFNDFVYSVLLLRDATQSIKRFCLEMRSELLNHSNLTKWVRFTLQKGLEELQLSVFNNHEMPNLPIQIFSSRTLVFLTLRGFTVNHFSSPVQLPSLKFLLLATVEFPKLEYFMKLLSGCPRLKELLIYDLACDCDTDFDSSVQFGALNLTQLVRADIEPRYFDIALANHVDLSLKALYNVEDLKLRLHMDYTGYYYIPDFHIVTHMELLFNRYSWKLIMDLLKHCPKLQILALDEDVEVLCFQEGPQAIWTNPESVPDCLSLHLTTCTFANYDGRQDLLMLARYIMKNAKVLQTMTISSGNPNPDAKLRMIKELSACPRSSPTCQLHFD